MQGYGKVYCASAVVLSCVSFESGQCRRQNPLETHRLPQTDFREALLRQGLYLERPIRTALYRWSSPCHSFKEESLKNALMLQHDKIMTRKRSLIETVNDQLKKRLSDRAYPPSVLLELYHQSAIGFGCFLLLRQKALYQHRWGVCTSLLPAGCLGRTCVYLTAKKIPPGRSSMGHLRGEIASPEPYEKIRRP